MTDNVQEINRMMRDLRAGLDPLYREIEQVIVGQRTMIDRLLVGLLTGGHMLLEGVPGLAKTLAVRTLAQGLHLSFQPHPVHARPAARRRHRHADLQPAHRRVHHQEGPDLRQPRPGRRDQPRPGQGAERPARSHAGEAGHHRRHQLSRCEQPFLVLATQNPIEQEGTYPLPEAQVDRFMLKLKLDLSEQGRGAGHPRPHGRRRAGPDRRAGARRRRTSSTCAQAIDQIYVDDKIKRYIVDIVHATRQPADYGLDIGAVHPVRRQPAGDDLPDARPPRRRRSSTAAATSRRRTSSRSATTCCAIASASPTRPRPRRSPPRSCCNAFSILESALTSAACGSVSKTRRSMPRNNRPGRCCIAKGPTDWRCCSSILPARTIAMRRGASPRACPTRARRTWKRPPAARRWRKSASCPDELVSLGFIEYKKSRKDVYCFAGPAPADAEPRPTSWEIDQARFVSVDEARRLLHPDQVPFLDRLLAHLGGRPSPDV